MSCWKYSTKPLVMDIWSYKEWRWLTNSMATILDLSFLLQIWSFWRSSHSTIRWNFLYTHSPGYVSIYIIYYYLFTNYINLYMYICRCWEDLSGFLGIFFLAFGAFVQMFYLILFSELGDFKGLLRSFETCFTIMLNKFDFGKIKVNLVKNKRR